MNSFYLLFVIYDLEFLQKLKSVSYTIKLGGQRRRLNL